MFRIIKHFILVLAIMSIISFIQMLILLKSPYYKNYPDVVRINLLRLTIASLQP